MTNSVPRSLACALLLCTGCASPFDFIDVTLAREARLALSQERPPQFENDEREESEEEPRRRSVIIGELLAIFPGVLWHGLGHYYAGDTRTARRIHTAGQWGYLLTALGGGMLVGGYFLDTETELQSFAISVYVAGGVTAGIGTGFFLTAWFYDMIDTPRAVLSGGEPPPPGSLFAKDLEEIGEE